jgi:spectinomycin phosphotransferase
VPPDEIDDRQLSRALEKHWGLTPARLGYLPVGFGDHHWELTDAAGRSWFVTVAGLVGGWRGAGPAAGYVDLRAAMDTVIALAGAGLEFAVAPVPTTDGRALAALGAEHAITVFPYLDGACRDVAPEMPPQDRLAVIDMLARLHSAAPWPVPRHRSVALTWLPDRFWKQRWRNWAGHGTAARTANWPASY